MLSIHDNGLKHGWSGRVWLNQPYSAGPLRRFLTRLVEHGTGTALIFARTDTDAFHRFVFDQATAVLWMRGRVCFFRPDGTQPTRRSGAAANAGGPSVLVAYGRADADRLAECGLAGRFEALRLPVSILVALDSLTWRQVVQAALAGIEGAGDAGVSLDAVYRALTGHPKTRANRHWRAKVRQQLQRGAGRRRGRGLWASGDL